MFKLNKFYIACCLLGLAIYTTPALANVCFAPSGGCYDLNGNYVKSDKDSPVTLTDCAGFNDGKLEEGPGWNCQTCVQASGATLYKCEKNKCSSSYNILKNQDEEPKERPGWECVSCWSGYDKFWYCPKHYCDPKYGPLKVSSSASPFNCSDTCPHGDDILYNCFCDSEHVEKGGSCVRECDANLHREYNPSTDTCDCESDYVERNGSCVHRDYSADCQAVVDNFVAKSYSPLSNSDCKALKVRLGISKCIGSTDYWAGAVKACGGVDFVPNKEELTKLAQCMYNSSSLASSIYGRRNTSYLEVLGLSTDDHVFVWSNTQSKKNTMSIVRMFALDKSIPYWAERDGSKYYIGNGTDPTDWENTSILSQTLCRRDGETPNSTCNPDEGMYYTEAECKAAHNIAWNSSFTRMWAAVVNNLIPIKEAFAAKPNVSVAIDSPSVVDTGSGYMISVGGKDCPCPKTGPGSGQATGQYDANGHATYYDLSDCCRALKDLNSDLNKLEDTITDSVDLTYQCKYDTTKKCWYAVVSGGGDGCYYDTVAQCKAAGYTYTAEERWWMQDENMTHECEPCNCGGTEMNKCVPVDGNNKVTVYYNAPTSCNYPFNFTNKSTNAVTQVGSATQTIAPGTYTVRPSTMGVQSFTIKMGSGGTPTCYNTSGTDYTFSIGNEYWIVPNCSSTCSGSSGTGSGGNSGGTSTTSCSGARPIKYTNIPETSTSTTCIDVCCSPSAPKPSSYSYLGDCNGVGSSYACQSSGNSGGTTMIRCYRSVSGMLYDTEAEGQSMENGRFCNPGWIWVPNYTKCFGSYLVGCTG